MGSTPAKVAASIFVVIVMVSPLALAQTPSINSISPDPYMPGRTLFEISGTGFIDGARVTIIGSSFDNTEVTLSAPEVEVVSQELIRVKLMADGGADIWHGLDGAGATFIVRNPTGEVSNEYFVGARPMTLHVVFLTHLDIGFTAPPSVVAERYKEFYDRIVEMLEADDPPDEDTRMRFTVETIWQIEQYMERSTPNEIARFVDLVNQGLIEVCAGYNTPNTVAISHEDLSRLFYPARQFRDRYGIDITTLIFDDQPGYGWGVADTAVGSGINYFLTGINIMEGTTIGGHPFPVDHVPFYWIGRSGSRLLTWPSIGEASRSRPWDEPKVIRRGAYGEAMTDYGMFLFEPWVGPIPDPKRDEEHVVGRVLRGLGYFADRDYQYQDILIMGANGDNNCAYNLLEPYGMEAFDLFESMTLAARRINESVENPHVVITTPGVFFQMFEEKYDGFPEIPAEGSEHGGDWPSQWEAADKAAPRATARARAARELAPTVEKLACLGELLGGETNYPIDDLAELWRLIRTWDEHTAAGYLPNTEVPFLDWNDALQHDIEHVSFACEASLIANRLISEQMAAVAANLAGGEHTRVVIFNPTGWRRTDVVEVEIASPEAFQLVDLETGRSIPYQISMQKTDRVLFLAHDVPANGYRIYEVVPVESAPVFPSGMKLDLSERRVENQFYRLILDDNGFPAKLVDKTTGMDIIDHESPFGFMRLAGINLMAAGMNGFGLDSISHMEPGETDAEIEVGEYGPTVASLLITRSDHPVSSMELRLLDGIKRLDVIMTIDLDRLEPIEYHGGHKTEWHVTFPFALDTDTLKLRVEAASGFLDPYSDSIPETYNDLIFVLHGLWMSDSSMSVQWATAEAFVVDLPTPEGLIGRVGGMSDGLRRPSNATILSNFFRDNRWDLVNYADGPDDDPGDQDSEADGYQAYPILEPGIDGALTLRYSFRTLDEPIFDPVDTENFISGTSNPLLAMAISPVGIPPDESRKCPPPSASLVRGDAPNVEISAFKRSDLDGSYIVRLREIAGKGGSITIVSDLFDIKSAQRVNLTEEPDDGFTPVIVDGGTAMLEIEPYETATLAIEDILLHEMDCGQPQHDGTEPVDDEDGCSCSMILHNEKWKDSSYLILLLLFCIFLAFVRIAARGES